MEYIPCKPRWFTVSSNSRYVTVARNDHLSYRCFWWRIRAAMEPCGIEGIEGSLYAAILWPLIKIVSSMVGFWGKSMDQKDPVCGTLAWKAQACVERKLLPVDTNQKLAYLIPPTLSLAEQCNSPYILRLFEGTKVSPGKPCIWLGVFSGI